MDINLTNLVIFIVSQVGVGVAIVSTLKTDLAWIKARSTEQAATIADIEKRLRKVEQVAHNAY